MWEHGRADREREAVAARDVGVQSRGSRVERVAGRHRGAGLMLDADGALIHREHAGVVRGVILADQLRDATVRADDVMRRQDARGILEPPDRAFEHDDRPVVDDELHVAAVAPDEVVARRHRTSPLDRHSTDETA